MYDCFPNSDDFNLALYITPNYESICNKYDVMSLLNYYRFIFYLFQLIRGAGAGGVDQDEEEEDVGC